MIFTLLFSFLISATETSAPTASTSTDPQQSSSSSSLQLNSDLQSNSELNKKTPTHIIPPEQTSFWSVLTNIPGDLKDFGVGLIAKDQMLPLTMTMVSSTVLYVGDPDLSRISSKNIYTNKDYYNIMNALEKSCGGIFELSTIFGFMGYGYFANDDRAWRTSLQIGRGILSSGIVVQILKRATGRQTPTNATSPRGEWHPFPRESEYKAHRASYDAVPSGHFTSTMVAFLIIAENYPEKAWIRYAGYPLMGAFAWSLTATRIHWWSDMPLAIYLGWRFAKIVTKNNDPYAPVAKDPNWDISPTISRLGTPMLQYSVVF